MKKFLGIFVLALAAASSASAKGSHTMSGCGLGYMLFNTDNSMAMQILASTTNGTFGNQTFGMTTGTLGCTEDGAVKWARRIEAFTEVNYTALRREMAAGEGEIVGTFASLLGANDAQRAGVVEYLKGEYASVFTSETLTPQQMLNNVYAKLAQKPELLS